MCRFAGFLGEAIAPAVLLYDGSHSLEVQSYRPRELLDGHVNVDGYGVAWYPGAKPVRIAEARPLWHDSDLEPLLRSVRSTAVLAAVRNTTPGIPVDRTGVPPLVHGRWSFALNGFVSDFRRRAMRRFHERLSDSIYASLRGASDTEALFLLFLDAVRSGRSPVEAMRDLIHTTVRITEPLETRLQLNLLASDGERLLATRMGSSPRQNTLYIARRYPASGPAGTVISSEPLDDPAGWDAVPEASLVEVEEGGSSVRISALEPE